MGQAQQLPEFSRGDVISKNYEVEEKLGEGMLGATYRVRHIKSKRSLALKVIRPSLIATPRDRERFERSFKAARAAKHDGVVKFGEIGEQNGVVFFTQEYFESQDLRTIMRAYQAQQKQFSLQEACQIVIKILEATEFLNKHGIIHKNLKPENVLVHTKNIGPGGGKIVRTIKITDCGFADIVNPSIFAEGYISRDEQPYLAPELTSFDEPGSPPSDVYSVGVILYELLVGQTPRGTYLSPTQLRGDLPEHIDDIVEVAMDATADGRYPTCQDMLNDIQRSFSGDIFEEKRVANFKNILIGVGVGVAIVAGYGFYLINFAEKPDPMAENRSKDQQLRKMLQSQNPLPDSATIDAMSQLHPEMLYIPGGTFVMGRLNAEPLDIASQSEPLAQVQKVDSFFIDRFEFPNALKGSEGNPVKPVSKVTWEQAQETCESIGKRLCTEEEWEKACKGPANWVYSYGDTYDTEVCGGGMDVPYHIGDRESCVSGYGVYDLSGGLREWTSTLHGPKGNRAVVKGGLRANNLRGSRCAFAVDESTRYADGTLSFRCCLDVGDKKAGKAKATADGDDEEAEE